MMTLSTPWEIAEASSAGVSLLFCLIICGGFLFFRSIRSSASKLVFFLCLSESISSASRLSRFIDSTNVIVCAVQSYMLSLGNLAVIGFISIITLTLCRSIQYGHPFVKDIMPYLISFSVIIPAILAGLILLRQWIQWDGELCRIMINGLEIGDSWNQRIWLVIQQQAPIYVALFFNIFMIIRAIQLFCQEHVGPSRAYRKGMIRVFSFSLTVPLCHLLGFIIQLYPDAPSEMISISIIMLSLQGAVNAMLFGFTQKLRANFYRVFSRNTESTVSTTLNNSLLDTKGRKDSLFSHPTTPNQTCQHDAEDNENDNNHNNCLQRSAGTPNAGSFVGSLSEMSDLDELSNSHSSPSKLYKLTIADF